MSLSGTRGLVRVSKNRQCVLLAAMAVEKVTEPDFYRLLTGTEYPGEYGERISARKRGAKFEANLHMNNAALLRQALAEVFDYDPEEMVVRNFELEAPGMRDGVRAARLSRMRRILKDVSTGRSVPHLLIQPQLALPIGIGPKDSIYVGPDFMVFDPISRIYIPGEEKSFIVRDGEAEPGDLELTRLQAGAQIVALRNEAALVGLDDRILDRGAFVFSTPYGLNPTPAKVELLRGEVTAIQRAVSTMMRAQSLLSELRVHHGGGTALENLASEIPIHFQENCVGSCVLASLCRERIESSVAVLGDMACDLLGTDFEIDRVIALAHGEPPINDRERQQADQLRDAANALGIEAGGGTG